MRNGAKIFSTGFGDFKGAFAVALMVFCVCAPGLAKPGHAQTTDQFYEEPEREIQAEKEALKAAKEAASRAPDKDVEK